MMSEPNESDREGSTNYEETTTTTSPDGKDRRSTADSVELHRLAAKGAELEFDSEAQRNLANAIFTVVDNFWTELPEIHHCRTDESISQKIFSLAITESPHPLDAILDVVHSGVIRTGNQLASGRHFGNIPGSGIPAAVMADFLAAATNKHPGVKSNSPGAVNVEIAVLEWAAELFGFEKNKFGGCLTSGSSMATTIGFAAARDAMGIKLNEYERCVIYTQINAHYCMEKGLRFLGLSECILRKIDVNKDQQISTEELEKQMQKDVEDGLRPFIVIGTIGTTACGAIDNMETLSSLSKRFGAWFHVDAAYGGFFILLEELKAKMSGVERADSIACDPHKSLFLPFGTGLLIVKRVEQLLTTHCFRADYIHYAEDDLATNHRGSLRHWAPADVSPELTRDFRGIRVWLPLLYHGTTIFKDVLNEKLQLARYLYSRLRDTADVELGPKPQLSIVVFRFVSNGTNPNGIPSEIDDQINEALVSRVTAEGRIFLGTIGISGLRWIRLAILCFRSHKEDVDLAFQLLLDARAEILEERAKEEAEEERAASKEGEEVEEMEEGKASEFQSTIALGGGRGRCPQSLSRKPNTEK